MAGEEKRIHDFSEKRDGRCIFMGYNWERDNYFQVSLWPSEVFVFSCLLMSLLIVPITGSEEF